MAFWENMSNAIVKIIMAFTNIVVVPQCNAR